MSLPALVRAVIRGTTALSVEGVRDLARRRRLWIVILTAAGIAVGGAALLFMLVSSYSGLLAVGIASGSPGLLFLYAVLGSWVFIFVTALPLALSVLYYSRDSRLLLTLPLHPAGIVGAKAVLLYLYCLPVNLVVLGPAIVVYAVRFGVTGAFAAAAVIHLVISPLLPLALAVLLVLALMKAVNLSRFRVGLEAAGMALGLVMVVGLQVLLSRTTMRSMMSGTFESLGQLPNLTAGISGALPPVAWAARGFTGPLPVLHDLLSILVSAALTGAWLLIAPVNFTQDIAERGESRRERAAVSGAEAGRMLRRRSLLMSLLLREWSVLTSNSGFIFEAAAELLILPLVLGVYSLILPRQVLAPAMGFINSSPFTGLILMAVIVLMTNITAVTSTSLSREGRLFALSLTVPVSGRDQLKAKLGLHVALFLPAYLLDLAVVYAVFRIPARYLAFLIPAGPIFLVAGFITGIFLDLKHPLLSWTHPQQAMKQNMNVVGSMGGIFGLLLLLGAPTALLVLRGVDPFLMGCLFPVLPLVLDILLLPRVLSFGDRQYGGGLEMTG
jgi:ABC-2 type transport system permease protein